MHAKPLIEFDQSDEDSDNAAAEELKCSLGEELSVDELINPLDRISRVSNNKEWLEASFFAQYNR